MIKRLTQWTPVEGMSRDDALTHWKDAHASLVTAVPGVVRYVQNHCVPGLTGEEPPYAGLGEVWFENRATAEEASSSAEWQAVLADAATFMDMSRISAAWAEEHVFP